MLAFEPARGPVSKSRRAGGLEAKRQGPQSTGGPTSGRRHGRHPWCLLSEHRCRGRERRSKCSRMYSGGLGRAPAFLHWVSLGQADRPRRSSQREGTWQASLVTLDFCSN